MQTQGMSFHLDFSDINHTSHNVSPILKSPLQRMSK